MSLTPDLQLMEACASYRTWYDGSSGQTHLKSTPGKCLHHYFYFIDEQFGLGYVRVPTWAPSRLQIYFNGHFWLARQLSQAGIAFEMADRVKVKGRSVRGFNLFLAEDYRLLLTLERGEWELSGIRATDLRSYIPDLTAGRSSFILKRLRIHGLIKKVAHRYKYYLTKHGRRVLTTSLILLEYFVLPSFAENAS